MSTDLGYIESMDGGKLFVTRFYGGVTNGPCIQMTHCPENGESTGYVRVSPADLIALMPVFLEKVVNLALENKAREARKAIEEDQELEKTIVKDMAEVAKMAINTPALEWGSILCLGAKRFRETSDEKIKSMEECP